MQEKTLIMILALTIIFLFILCIFLIYKIGELKVLHQTKEMQIKDDYRKKEVEFKTDIIKTKKILITSQKELISLKQDLINDHENPTSTPQSTIKKETK